MASIRRYEESRARQSVVRSGGLPGRKNTEIIATRFERWSPRPHYGAGCAGSTDSRTRCVLSAKRAVCLGIPRLQIVVANCFQLTATRAA